jgi:glycerate kinase
VPGRTALCLAGEDLAPDPLAERLAGADLAVGLFEVLEFRDGGGPELARLSDAAAAAAIPLVVLSSRLDVSARELRVLGVEAAYALDPADSAVVLERLARTWSW